MNMAATGTTTEISKDFQNWLKGAISILYAREGLTEFVQNEIEQSMQYFLQTCIKQNGLSSETKCSACTTANVLCCPTNGFCGKLGHCNAHDPNIPEKTPGRPCPNGICNTLKDNIQNQHRYAWPSWKNTDARRWCTDAYEISKCFLPTNSSHLHSLTETDFNGLISIIINDKRFQNKIHADLNTQPNVCTKAREAVNAIWHSADHLLPDKDLAVYIDDMIALFSDQAYLATDPKAQNAVKNLKRLKMNAVIGRDELIALKAALRASEKATLAQFDVKENESYKNIQNQHSIDPMDTFAAILNKYKSKIMADIQKQVGNEKQQMDDLQNHKSTNDQVIHKRMEKVGHFKDNQITDCRLHEIQDMVASEIQGMVASGGKVIVLPIVIEFEEDKLSSTAKADELKYKQEFSLPVMIEKEPSYWEHYLKLPVCEELDPAERIKQSKWFPNQNQLNRLHKKYSDTKSKCSLDLLSHIERWIFETVKNANDNVRYAWLANKHDSHNVNLILEIEESDKSINLKDMPFDYETYSTQYNSFSEEAEIVMQKGEDLCKLSFFELNEIRNCIQRNSDTWLASHRHLSVVDASSVRSKGFNSSSSEHILIPEKCIVFYVRKKGFIPIGEEPFESKYDGFPIDVREGVFYPLMQASADSQDKLKMGLTIYKRLSTGDKRGTLGGFIDHPQYGLCGLTCAHVLLDDFEMTKLQDKGELSWLDFTPESASVYIKNKHAGNNMGNYIKIERLVKAVISKGEDDSHGMEIAIFQIEKCFPSNGLFVNERLQVDDHLRFDSGKIYGPSRLNEGMKVFKFGSTTGKTSGVILERVPVTTVTTLADIFPAKIVMHNQLKIKGINGTEFAAKGDSGAFVLIDEQNEDVYCVGIVEGILSFNNVTIVTPIGPVLEKISVSSLKRFEIDHTLTSVRRLERSLEQTNRHIEQTKNELRGSVKDLETNTNQRLENNLEQMKLILQENQNAIQENVNRVDRDLTSTRAEILTTLHNLKQTEERGHLCIII